MTEMERQLLSALESLQTSYEQQKQKKLIMLPSETMIWQPEFTDKTLSRKPGAVQFSYLKAMYH
ncbi:MbeD/MobD family mobilization/exclusion protein, partial [Escherichia coli]|uniref:MbeD/MobD family mobilization/exclusion protein n=1 Tax=Escherichia coli TaxID=562 RepID=UPI003EDEF32F